MGYQPERKCRHTISYREKGSAVRFGLSKLRRASGRERSGSRGNPELQQTEHRLSDEDRKASSDQVFRKEYLVSQERNPEAKLAMMKIRERGCSRIIHFAKTTN